MLEFQISVKHHRSARQHYIPHASNDWTPVRGLLIPTSQSQSAVATRLGTERHMAPTRVGHASRDGRARRARAPALAP
jgi:hypothetical protein